jgi:hypothetical protein
MVSEELKMRMRCYVHCNDVIRIFFCWLRGEDLLVWKHEAHYALCQHGEHEVSNQHVEQHLEKCDQEEDWLVCLRRSLLIRSMKVRRSA